MKNRFGKSVVPISALRPLIEEWLAKQERESEDLGWDRFCTPEIRLAQDAGVHRRKINGILNGNLRAKPGVSQDNVSFDMADKLLCAMGMNAEWHIRLAEYYDEIDVAPYERHLTEEELAA